MQTRLTPVAQAERVTEPWWNATKSYGKPYFTYRRSGTTVHEDTISQPWVALELPGDASRAPLARP